MSLPKTIHYFDSTGECRVMAHTYGDVVKTRREIILESLCSAYAEYFWFNNMAEMTHGTNMDGSFWSVDCFIFWAAWSSDAEDRIQELQCKLAEMGE